MYLGNPNLRHAQEKIEFTEELLEEYLKCKEDIVYFAENYFKIVSIDEGEINIPLYEFQKRMLKAFVGDDEDPRKSVVCLSSRQIGKCVSGNSNILIKNKKTGEIREMEIGKFHEMNNM
jgi:hypothetical protein